MGNESCFVVVACLTIVECSAQTKDYDQKIERERENEGMRCEDAVEVDAHSKANI